MFFLGASPVDDRNLRAACTDELIRNNGIGFVLNLADTEEKAVSILYPGIDDFSALYNEYAYRNLDSDMLSYLNSLWETLKIG